MSFDHRSQVHSNWRFLGKRTPRRCPGYEPPDSLGDKVVVIGCLVLLGVALAFRFWG